MSAKPCKYECGTMITWDPKNSRFTEADGTPHTKERCASLKQPKAAEPGLNDRLEAIKMHDETMASNRLLVAAINRLAAAIEARK